MERALIVYTTFPDQETASAIAESFVTERLAACVNLLPGMRSVYAWKGTLERGEEVVGIIKTRASLKEAVRDALVARHPYETPIVLFLPVEGGSAQTLAWLAEETASRP